MADINFIITQGIGTPGDIIHFILDGLNPLASPEEVPNFGLASPGETITLFDDKPSEGGVFSDSVILPSVNCQITWQTSYASTPLTANVQLQVSIDGLHFNTIDTTTDTAGEIRTLLTAARFARAIFGSMEDAILTTVKLVVKEVSFSPL